MVIALVDWNWMGHHPTYFTFFASALAKLEHNVLPICPNPEEFLSNLEREKNELLLSKKIYDPELIRSFKESKIRPIRWRGIHNTWRMLRSLRGQLRSWENRNHKQIDLIFFACIYDHVFRYFPMVEFGLNYPCSGLYLHARHFRIPNSPLPYVGGLSCGHKILAARAFRSVGLLDEGVVNAVQSIMPGKPVVVFPDVTSESVPAPSESESGLARKIRKIAGNRPIITLAGHLQHTKGLEEFTATAENPALAEAIFVLAGEVNWKEISPSTKKKLERKWAELPNLFTHLSHLSEPVMNALISETNVIFAAYRNFPNSSNVLTKAAVFEKGILVSDGYLMAERVRSFKMGEVVPEGSVSAICITLSKMLQPGYQEALSKKARWSDYRSLHSSKRLPSCFGELLKKS